MTEEQILDINEKDIHFQVALEEKRLDENEYFFSKKKSERVDYLKKQLKENKKIINKLNLKTINEYGEEDDVK